MSDRTKGRSSAETGVEVDRLLKRLETANGVDGEGVVDELRSRLIAPGTLSDAAVDATPRLVELAGREMLGAKGAVLRLLADVAVFGVHTWWLDDGYDLRGGWFDEVELDHPARTTHLAVETGFEAYLASLRADDPNEQAAAAFLLAFLSRRAEDIVGPLRDVALDVDRREFVRATAHISLGYVDGYLKAPSVDRSMRNDAGSLLRVAMTIGLAKAAPAALADEDLDCLRDACIEPPEGSADVPWCDGELDLLAGSTLGLVAFGRGEEAVLRDLVARSSGTPIAEKLAVLLADTAFGQGRAAPELVPAAQDLPAGQRRALEVLLRSNLVPAVELETRGVFRSRHALERYLGIGETGPLDVVVDGEPLWRRFFATLRGSASREEYVAAALRGRTPREVLALAMDMTDSVYTLHPPLTVENLGGDDEAYYEGVRRLASDVLASGTSREFLELALAEELRSPHLSLRCASLLGAWHRVADGVAVPEEADVLFGAALQPEHHDAMIPVLRALPPSRAESVVLGLDWEMGLRRGAALPAGWSYAEACPSRAVLDAAIESVLSAPEGELPEDAVKEVLVILSRDQPLILKRAAIKNTPRKALFEAAVALSKTTSG